MAPVGAGARRPVGPTAKHANNSLRSALPLALLLTFSALSLCVNASVTIYTGNVCEAAMPLVIYCPPGLVVGSITSAFYGRSDTTTCTFPDPNAMKNDNCSAPGFKAKVIDMCVGKAACSVPNFAVPDPCGGTYKWASVGFTCQPEDMQVVGPVCDEQLPVRIQCPKGLVVDAVYSAFYGRDDATTCPYAADPNAQTNTNCSSAGYRDQVEAQCVGQAGCAIGGDLSADPCVGTYKYAKVSYKCAPPDERHVGPVCDGSLPLVLSCPEGEAISYVSSAFYGRTDTTTCPYKWDDPASKMAKTNCVAPDYRAKVRELCVGEARCEVPFNAVPDPCFGTYKWAKASFACEKTVVCGDTYVVQEGDSCGMIAERNGLEVQELEQLNADRGMECTALVPGLELCVDVEALPGGSNGCSPTYRLALADTCASVAAAFNTTTARLQELNPGLDCMGLVPGQPLCMGTSGDNTDGSDLSGCHPTTRVEAGDTCNGLADDWDLTTFQLLLLNPGLNCSALTPGQGLCMGPAGGGIDDDECGRALQVAAGDTCASLAGAAGITEQQLQQLNEGLDCADLQPGDVVCVAETGCMCYDGTYSQSCCEGFLLNLPPPAPAAAAPAPGAMGPSPSYGWSTPWPSTYGSGGVIAADGTVPVAAATYGGGVEGPQAVALAMGEGDVSAKLSVVRQANGYASVADSYTLSQALDGSTVGTFQFLLEPDSKDIFAIKYYGQSQTTEVHILAANSNYTAFSLQTPTALAPTTSDSFTFLLASNKDVYAIKYAGDSGYTELHVILADGNYQRLGWEVPTALRPSNPEQYQFALGPNDDLYAIMYAGTASGMVEVYGVSSSSRWASFTWSSRTALATSAPGEFRYTIDRDTGDLWALKYAGASGKVEVHVLPRAVGYQGFSLHLATVLPSTTAMKHELLLDRGQNLYAVMYGGEDNADPVPAGGCWGSMEDCIHDTWLADAIGIDPNPANVSGPGTPPLNAPAGSVFSTFSAKSLANTTSEISTRSPCPLIVLTGQELADMSGKGGFVSGLFIPSLGTAAKACKKVAAILKPDDSYILGAAAFDMSKPAAGEADAAKAQEQISFLGKSVALCAAINPCKNVYAFGFEGVSVTIPVWPEPPIDLTLTLDVAAYAADEENLLMPVESSWRYGGVGTGKFEPATFQANVLGSGTASLGIGFKNSDGKAVATLEAEGQLTFGINLDPAKDGKGGDDHGFAVTVHASPKVNIMDKFTMDLGGLQSTRVDAQWTYINRNDFKFQLSLTREFELSGLFAQVSFIKEAVEHLIDAKGTASINLYVDQDFAAIFLDLRGEINVLPDLPVPRVNGELGVLMVVAFGSGDPFRVSLVINDKLYCLSAYGRSGHGIDTCPSGTVKDPTGALCYPPCRPGYWMMGFMCHQDCPSGFSQFGFHCTKPSAYGRGVGYPWKFGDGFNLDGAFSRCERENSQGCEQWAAVVYPKCRPGFHNVGCCVCSPDCPPGMTDIGVSCQQDGYVNGIGSALKCGDNENQELFMCYEKCRAGYYGVGPTCWQTCS